MEISDFFKEHNEVAVAFSGGVDSAVLLYLACKYAKRVKAYFVKSQFQPEFELNDAYEISKHLNAELQVLNTDILKNNDVVKNNEKRCYYCKKSIFTLICDAAHADGFSDIIEGTNASDDTVERQGFKALGELKVFSPLKICLLTKSDIREIAKAQGLSVADKPSYSCLATRIPTGTPINERLIKLTESSEEYLKEIGFNNFRVRYLDGFAKLELGEGEFKLFSERREEIYNALIKEYNGVFLDIKERTYE